MGGRKLIFLLVVLALAVAWAALDFYQPKAVSLVEWRSLDVAAREARDTAKPILYDFSADWCRPCKIMDREVFANQAIAQVINNQFVPVRVVDRKREEGKNPPEVEELQDKYDVSAFPTVVATAPTGEPYDQFVGFRPAGSMHAFLDRVLALHRQGSAAP